MSKEIKNKENQKVGEIERRTFKGNVEIRNDDNQGQNESRTVFGYAALFEVETELWEGYFEVIARGAFDNVMEDDVRALFNHDNNLILARTGSTLEIGTDEKGLWYRFEAPNTTAGNDLVENIRLGNVTQSSYGFRSKENSYKEELRNGVYVEIRTILEIKNLYDVSPVTYPAYETTEVSLRCLQEFRDKKKTDDPDTQNPNLTDNPVHPRRRRRLL